MVDYAEYQLGLTKAIASRLASVHGIGQVVGVLTVLPLSDSLGRKKTILISNALIAVAMVAIPVVGNQVLLLYFFCRLCGYCLWDHISNLWALCRRLFSA